MHSCCFLIYQVDKPRLCLHLLLVLFLGSRRFRKFTALHRSGEGYVFTSVCSSVILSKRGEVPVHGLGPTPCAGSPWTCSNFDLTIQSTRLIQACSRECVPLCVCLCLRVCRYACVVTWVGTKYNRSATKQTISTNDEITTTKTWRENNR